MFVCRETNIIVWRCLRWRMMTIATSSISRYQPDSLPTAPKSLRRNHPKSPKSKSIQQSGSMNVRRGMLGATRLRSKGKATGEGDWEDVRLPRDSSRLSSVERWMISFVGETFEEKNYNFYWALFTCVREENELNWRSQQFNVPWNSRIAWNPKNFGYVHVLIMSLIV